ncbi:type II toxin-antitoxin system HigB family toxin [Duganella vulcania]|uniref:Type II toxin-antitoxin system HigB family toxin n=1 Tax=Duganella vulcania TaxID=2692166 RepID=A0A845GPL2_9BURK|nr:type II toxin-antitoxin system HigB family toxin [Duganella vulcania]MYM94667.1 type II toxin-antitoxin system HigB family toxin [Duganella vulcania]
MQLIATNLLDDFCMRHPNARIPIAHWRKVMAGAFFPDYVHLRRTFRHADYAAPFTIFNVGGNNYRIISRIEYSRDIAQIRWVLTHSEYDKWTRRFLKGEIKS